MDSVRHSFHHQLLLFSLISLSYVSGTQFSLPRLGALRRKIRNELDIESISSLPEDFKTFFYSQTLDHFNYKPESFTCFQQRYVINSKYWGGANTSSPILVYFGAEESLDYDLSGIGFLTDNAPRFKALLVYIEHRFYGKSIPCGLSREAALRNASIRGYFTSAQAIADYAAIILHIKKTFFAKNSPVIVIGGSYGGMLAAWFRLKYPHVALGALASSAPILYFDELAPHVGYYAIVTKDFKETSESCYETIRKSWDEIDKVASKSNGLSTLSMKFKTCEKLKRSFDLKDFLDSIYSEVAQYDHPPSYPLNIICRGIDGAPKGTDILDRIFAGVVAYMGNNSCYDMNEFNRPNDETYIGWRWQTCSEMVMPIGHENNDSMFPPSPFNLNKFIRKCKSLFGVRPRPHWVTTYYGGHDLKLILHRFASNIIFSNGLRDPYSSGGVLENISDSVVAVYTVNGSHCLDILPEKKGDPVWLIKQRKTEVGIIKSWISKYYTDLIMFRDRTRVSS